MQLLVIGPIALLYWISNFRAVFVFRRLMGFIIGAGFVWLLVHGDRLIFRVEPRDDDIYIVVVSGIWSALMVHFAYSCPD